MEEEPPRFAADRMLMRLARWLRLLGADVLCDESLYGGALLRAAREQNRVVLTRDKRLRTAPEALYLSSNDFRGQLREVLARHPFDPRRHAFSRCSRCNQPLVPVSRDAVQLRVPPFVYANHEHFARCQKCDRIYWYATHPERALREVEALGVSAQP